MSQAHCVWRHLKLYQTAQDFCIAKYDIFCREIRKCLHYLARPHSHEARCHRSDKIYLSDIHELSYHPLCLFCRLLPLVKCIIPVKFLYDRGSAGILPGIYIIQRKRWGDIIFLFAISMAMLLNGAVTSSQSSPILGLIMLIPFCFVTIYNKKTCNNCKS